MRVKSRRSREIIEILSDVVKQTASQCIIHTFDAHGNVQDIECPEINYVFGNAQYVKDKLDELSTSIEGNNKKFPLIALFCPFKEDRGLVDYYTKAKVRVLIACSSVEDWSNETRLETSFKNILRPIYREFLEALRNDGRFDLGYYGIISHEYSENYSYGRYGAHTDTGEKVSEPIDAINITNLELSVKKENCR